MTDTKQPEDNATLIARLRWNASQMPFGELRYPGEADDVRAAADRLEAADQRARLTENAKEVVAGIERFVNQPAVKALGGQQAMWIRQLLVIIDRLTSEETR